ncbi:Ribosomal RNA-processing protein 8 [Rhodotorula toruloides ATCC 204091]|uniref:Ribosomal RNA-processing protein 8 n=1 Tax=Rhodotorula toruloides TaxID=5286 RepID=A0A0K3CK78_RHOTO|nr:Ribosomal RNA-processing protein 8 [Rhodotorula toruloides ATCC 204091]PRQ74600.1 ribosomal RNA-processing protein 8 [Rhodotorula toruloides]
MLFDTPLLNLAPNAPVASSSSAGAPSTAPGSASKKRKRSSSITRDGSLTQGGGKDTLPGAEINVEKLLKKMKQAEDASSPAARSIDLPEPATTTTKASSTSASSSNPRPRHSAPSQTVTASTSTASTRGGSMQDKLRAQLAGGKFRMLNETLYTTSGDEAHRLMKEDGAFENARLRSFAATWPVHPLALIAQSLLSSLAPNSLIADFGCGDAALARSLCPCTSTSSQKLSPIPSLKLPPKLISQKSLKVVSFDLVSQSSFVVEAECSSVPLPGGTAGGEVVDAVVCCLSLMGTDWVGMVREAKRVLKHGGLLKIAEVTSRFTSVDDFVKLVSALGFSLKHEDESNTHFLLLDFVKKNGPDAREDPHKVDEHTRKASTLLNPCIYKRR